MVFLNFLQNLGLDVTGNCVYVGPRACAGCGAWEEMCSSADWGIFKGKLGNLLSYFEISAF